MKEKIEYEENIILCKNCLIELQLQSNDLDSYYKCDKCGNDNFTGHLKTIDAKKQQIIRLIY